jgi:hypothetical protein
MTLDGGHETRDINLKGVAIFVVTLVLTLIAVHFVVIETLRSYIRNEPRPELTTLVKESTKWIGPGLLVKAPVQLHELRVREDQILSSSGWIDRGQGIVRIPIDQAMDLVIRHGLPKSIGETSMFASGGRAQ